MSYSSFPGSCRIIPILQNPRVDRGEVVKIYIYISGAGDIGGEEHQGPKRIKIFHHYDNLFAEDAGMGKIGFVPVRESDIEQEETNFVGSDSSSGWAVLPRDEAPESYRVDIQVGSEHSTIHLPDWVFEEVPVESEAVSSEIGHGSEQSTFPDKLAEAGWGGKPPVILELNIAEDAEPGDYDIDFVFSFTSDGEIITEDDTVTFHVNNWIEEKQPYLKWAVVTIALLGILLPIFIP